MKKVTDQLLVPAMLIAAIFGFIHWARQPALRYELVAAGESHPELIRFDRAETLRYYSVNDFGPARS